MHSKRRERLQKKLDNSYKKRREIFKNRNISTVDRFRVHSEVKELLLHYRSLQFEELRKRIVEIRHKSNKDIIIHVFWEEVINLSSLELREIKQMKLPNFKKAELIELARIFSREELAKFFYNTVESNNKPQPYKEAFYKVRALFEKYNFLANYV